MSQNSIVFTFHLYFEPLAIDNQHSFKPYCYIKDMYWIFNELARVHVKLRIPKSELNIIIINYDLFRYFLLSNNVNRMIFIYHPGFKVIS